LQFRYKGASAELKDGINSVAAPLRRGHVSDNRVVARTFRLRFGIESYFVRKGEVAEIEKCPQSRQGTVVAAGLSAPGVPDQASLIDGESRSISEPLYD